MAKVFRSNPKGKIIQVSIDDLMDNTARDRAVLLSRSTLKALLAMTEYLSWETRYSDAPTDAQIQAIYSQVVRELLEPMTYDATFEDTDRVGMIFAVISSSTPIGALSCIGQTVTIEQYPILVQRAIDLSYPGVTLENPEYGGIDTFTLPDLTGRALFGSGGGLSLGATGGSSTHTLTGPETPKHTHDIGLRRSGNSALDGRVSNADTAGVGVVTAGNATTSDFGNNQPHNNMPPYYVVRWVMWALPYTYTVNLEQTYDVFAQDCVLFDTANGVVSEILDITQCIDDKTRITNDDTDTSINNDLNCMYGGVVSAVDYVLDNLVGVMEKFQAGSDYLQDLLNFAGATTMIKAIAGVFTELVIPIYIADINDPDTRQEFYCELFCQILTSAPDVLYPPSDVFDTWIDSYQFTDLPVYYMAKIIGAGKIAKMFYIGQDECDNDWLLCDCVNEIQFVVNADGSVTNVSGFIAGQTYVITWRGTMKYAGGANAIEDGVYAKQDSVNWSYNGKVQHNNSGSYVAIAPPTIPRSENGYTVEIVAQSSTISFKYTDTPTSDNSGQLQMYAVLRF